MLVPLTTLSLALSLLGSQLLLKVVQRVELGCVHGSCGCAMRVVVDVDDFDDVAD
jgi:hypothetical protein